MTRIYVVTCKDRPTRLVEANNPNQAIRHCVKQVYAAHTANAKDVARYLGEGMTIEVAGAEPETATNE